MPAYAALPSSTCYGTLSLNGIAMQRAAWWVDLTPLYRGPDVRGSDRLLPGVTGVKAYPRRRTVTRHSLRLLISGQYDAAGAATALDPEEQLEAHVAWLNANLLHLTDVGDGTVPAVWTKLSGATITADVHVMPLPEPTFLPGALLRTTIELEDPAGALHL